MNFTIVTAVTPNYEAKLNTTIKTWKIKPQFANQKLLLFAHGFTNAKEKFKDIWHDIEIVEWDNKGGTTYTYGNSIRESMLSAFVFGAANYVNDEYWCKLDADCYFTDSRDIFTNEDLQYDICAHRWGYSFSNDLLKLKEWEKTHNIPGVSPFNSINIDINNRRTYHKRFASWCCLHKNDFVIEVVSLINSNRLPCPSHDTTLWYFAERLPNRKWSKKMIKKIGANNSSDINVIIENINTH